MLFYHNKRKVTDRDYCKHNVCVWIFMWTRASTALREMFKNAYGLQESVWPREYAWRLQYSSALGHGTLPTTEEGDPEPRIQLSAGLHPSLRV